jgi:glycosyltransferase involved in cell wall biosynthesis
MQQFVVFLGERSDISDIMRQARALIIPSRFEGFGLCMPEAMFQGCLAIGHNTAGTKEQLDNGLELTGKEIALRYNTIEELTQLLKTVTERPSSDFDGYRLRAFDTVNQLYSSESNANSIYKFYNDIIQHKIH